MIDTNNPLPEDSDFFLRLAKVEALCEKLGIIVETSGNTTVIDAETGQSYMVGEQKDYEPFPRQFDVPFYPLTDDSYDY